MIYLDNAATTFPKPRAVIEEVTRALTEYGGNPGRGAHRLSLAAAERVYTCRAELAAFFGVGAPERVVFTQNTTHALNLALKGLLRDGDRVLCSELEHNAVRRPLHALAARGVTYDTFPVVGLTEAELLAEIEARLTPRTRAVVAQHASNVCSLSLPIGKIGALCRRRGLLFIVDAAQSAGILPLDLTGMRIDALALPGHKSLYGIQGCGVLALGERVLPRPLTEGGSGAASLSPDMPEDLPERLEAGTLSTPAIAGLLAGLRAVREMGLSEIERREKALFCAVRERLFSLPDVEILEPQAEGAVLLFKRRGVSSVDVARALDRAGICVRAGLHCAPLAHRALGTLPDGAVRVSFGMFNTTADADALYRAMKESE